MCEAPTTHLIAIAAANPNSVAKVVFHRPDDRTAIEAARSFIMSNAVERSLYSRLPRLPRRLLLGLPSQIVQQQPDHALPSALLFLRSLTLIQPSKIGQQLRVSDAPILGLLHKPFHNLRQRLCYPSPCKRPAALRSRSPHRCLLLLRLNAAISIQPLPHKPTRHPLPIHSISPKAKRESSPQALSRLNSLLPFQNSSCPITNRTPSTTAITPNETVPCDLPSAPDPLTTF